MYYDNQKLMYILMTSHLAIIQLLLVRFSCYECHLYRVSTQGICYCLLSLPCLML